MRAHGENTPFSRFCALAFAFRVQGLTMYNYGRLAAYRPTFLIATVAMLFCMGGNFAMFPAQTFRMFGANGASVRARALSIRRCLHASLRIVSRLFHAVAIA